MLTSTNSKFKNTNSISSTQISHKETYYFNITPHCQNKTEVQEIEE